MDPNVDRRRRHRPRRDGGRRHGARQGGGRDHARSGCHADAEQVQGPAASSPTRAPQKDTLDVFGGEYPGGSLYTRADWIAKNEATVQKMTNAIMATLKWIHAHTPEEIMAKMPEN